MASHASLTSPTTFRISHVNSLSDEDFITTFGNVIEHCSLVAAAVVSSRPFHSLQHLHAEICSFIDELPVKGREGILRSHPDLAGRAAMAGQLTQESSQEQKSAGLGNLTQQERSNLDLMNTRCWNRGAYWRSPQQRHLMTAARCRLNITEITLTSRVMNLK
ncbi:2-oxo-4-hydroxy-4-carboxy-5-ureidoimidazoline decarboxylase-like isoform X2 [Scylla paramamosain]|uniref:2-oxo-4-hydroxy-4-carboxy-5-ureidoimidazoline decarboxylase-like isoform X2 n=1 Tax=Scylla paramamosain TaxID=85552 RepID=UPI0030833C98